MRAFWQHPSVRTCRKVFRYLRVGFLLLVLLVVIFGAYLHWAGLPDFLKKPILAHLRERGFEAQFSSMRLGWGPGVIIENASFQRSGDQPEPKLSTARAELELMAGKLARGKVALKSLEVLDGKLQFPPAGQSSNALSLDNVQLQLLFVTTNFIRLTNATAIFRGVRIAVDGELAHADAVRDWKFLRPGRAKRSWQALLAKTTDVLDQIHFAKTPKITLNFSADARDLNTAKAHLSATGPDVSTPWGDARGIHLEADCVRPLSTNETFFRLDCGIDDAATRWAQGSTLALRASFSRDEQFNLTTTNHFSAAELDATWGTNSIQSTGLQWDGTAGLNGTNFHLVRVGGHLGIDQARSSWAAARSLDLNIAGAVTNTPVDIPADWGIWRKLAPFRFTWSLAGSEIVSPTLKLASVSLAGEWSAPLVQATRLEAKLYDGELTGRAQVNVATRELTAAARANFDERRVTPVLTPAAQHWLAQFDWKTPPDVSAQIRLILPAWTNRHPDWAGEVRPTIEIAGDFSSQGGSFRGVPVASARSRFGYTNRVWTLPGLRATRPDGEVEFSYTGSEATHDFCFLIDSAVDPQAAQILLPEAQRHWFKEASFTTPPKIHAEVWGRWHEPDRLGARAQISATNFIAHGERVDSFAASLDYTNRFLRLRDARLVAGIQYGAAQLIVADLAQKKITLTNVLGSVSPDLVRRLMAPRTPKWLELIQFEQPPAVRLAGSFEFGNPLATDLRFEVLGERFHFTNIIADKISGGVKWTGRHVVLTNVQAALYNTGSLVGWCMFDYVPKHGTDFTCDMTAKDVDLPVLATGLTGRTNKLEGMLDGQLTIDRASSTDRKTWAGVGRVHVHNALLWDIKIFGVFSPVLNAISPGSGNSRAYDASADFVVTNGVVSTDDLVVHATGFRLLYRGSVNSENKQIDARVEAALLRDTRIFGPVLSALLSPLSKLFEYKVSGDLRNPKTEPVFIPQPLMLLLRPFHTLKTMGESSPATNSAPSGVTAPDKR